MHGLINHLTAATFAVHMVLGCCWHHGHACSHGDGSHAHAGESTGESACAAHSHGHHHDPAAACEHGEDAPRDGEPVQHQCDEGACVFVAAEKPLTAVGVADGPWSIIVSDLPAIQAGLGHVAHWRPAATLDLPPPLRSHLAKRVLLI